MLTFLCFREPTLLVSMDLDSVKTVHHLLEWSSFFPSPLVDWQTLSTLALVTRSQLLFFEASKIILTR